MKWVSSNLRDDIPIHHWVTDTGEDQEYNASVKYKITVVNALISCWQLKIIFKGTEIAQLLTLLKNVPCAQTPLAAQKYKMNLHKNYIWMYTE